MKAKEMANNSFMSDEQKRQAEVEYHQFHRRLDAFWASVSGHFSMLNNGKGSVRDRDSRESCESMSQEQYQERYLSCPIYDMPF